MKFNTKQKRCIAIVDAYQAKFKKDAVTMEEVSVWAISSGLYPIPKRGDSAEECEDWERRLEVCISMNDPTEEVDIDDPYVVIERKEGGLSIYRLVLDDK